VDKLNVKAIFRKNQNANYIDPDAHIKMVTENTFKKGRFGSHQNNQPFEHGEEEVEDSGDESAVNMKSSQAKRSL
jgi:hypothetical protein